MLKRCLICFCSAVAMLLSAHSLLADPCGMVPPIYTGEGPPITRIGLQKTYVFHKDGVETFVIRPGFSGNVDEFGMLIPFPSVPAIRKVPDDVFGHLVNAIDPPEVVIDLTPRRRFLRQSGRQSDQSGAEEYRLGIKRDEVKVLKQEAVGMYEVAVLAAGSANALRKWMDEHGFRYPDGMDKVTEEYIKEDWCFVAVKTKVGEKDGVNPKPGQRSVDGKMKPGSTFDGFVQAMGFRFESEKLIVPMRLSAFNAGELRNVVYIMTDGPRKIRNIPEEYVVRQISGDQLIKNVTELLPLRIIGGNVKSLGEEYIKQLAPQRDPKPKNGFARELFAADLKAASSRELSLQHEEDEKQLLQIGEYFGLRGADIDKENAAVLAEKAERATADSLKDLSEMTLTVVDGEFPREVLAKKNLTFANYRMPAKQNTSQFYDAKQFGPGTPAEGVLIQTGSLDLPQDSQVAASQTGQWLTASLMLGFSLCLIGSLLVVRRHAARRFK